MKPPINAFAINSSKKFYESTIKYFKESYDPNAAPEDENSLFSLINKDIDSFIDSFKNNRNYLSLTGLLSFIVKCEVCYKELENSRELSTEEKEMHDEIIKSFASVGITQKMVDTIVMRAKMDISEDFEGLEDITDDGKFKFDENHKDREKKLNMLVNAHMDGEDLKELSEADLLESAKSEVDQPYIDRLNKITKEFNDNFKGNEKNNVLFDREFLEHLNPHRIRDLVDDHRYDEDDLLYNNAARWRREADEDSASYTTVKGQRAAAVSRFEAYFGLKDKLAKKSFLDILKHPWNTLQEYLQMKGAKNDIKNAYGLSDKAIDKTYEIIMGGEDGEPHIPDDFGGIEKNGTIIKNKASQEEIDAKFNDLKKKAESSKLKEKTDALREKVSEDDGLIKINSSEKIQYKNIEKNDLEKGN